MSLRINACRLALRSTPLPHSFIGISKFIRRKLPLIDYQSPRSWKPNVQCGKQFHTGRKTQEAKSNLAELLRDYKQSLTFPAATHEIKQLSKADLGQDVILHGYLGPRSDLSKNLSFIPLLSKELDHSIQIISSAKNADGADAHAAIKSIETNSPVIVNGLVKTRQPSNQDLGEIKKIKDVEIELRRIRCLNEFPSDVILTHETRFPAEQRHLQLRTDKALRDALAFRAKAASICRDVLDEEGFVEIETPLLFKSTPEGAREFLVPTRTKGHAYALPQSPQQYKQILMASGIPRYYQLARCFRDEDLRADRQPEFTQLDLEMSFATGETVKSTIESLIKRLWADLLDIRLPAKSFPEMTYQEAMSNYGSDKPDTRLGMKISRIEHLLPVDLVSKIGPLTNPIVEILKLSPFDSPAAARGFVSAFMDSSEAKPFQENPEGQPGIFIYDHRKPLQGLQAFGFEAAEYLEEALQLEDGDVVVLQARKGLPFSGSSTPLGNLRLALHRAAVTHGYLPAPIGFDFLWITDFPLFFPSNDTDPGQGGAAGLSSTHHPFTAPKSPSDVDLLLTQPLKATGEHYDLVVNGVELGGGSKRIHHARIQELVLKDVLQMSDERLKDFAHLLEVLRAGCPPHAGIALGFDRLCAVMLGRESVRDVIAFPKSGRGEDLLVKSPTPMSQEALDMYHLQLKN